MDIRCPCEKSFKNIFLVKIGSKNGEIAVSDSARPRAQQLEQSGRNVFFQRWKKFIGTRTPVRF